MGKGISNTFVTGGAAGLGASALGDLMQGRYGESAAKLGSAAAAGAMGSPQAIGLGIRTAANARKMATLLKEISPDRRSLITALVLGNQSRGR